MNMFGAKRYIAFAAILLALSGAAWGQMVWDGGGDGTTWTDGDNWLTNTVPGPGDTVNFFNAGFETTPTVTITIAGPVTVAGITTTNNQDDPFTLTFAGGGSITVNGDMEFFRPTLDAGSDVATYVFNLDVTCTGTVTTHSGTTVSVPAGNQFQANTVQQSALFDTPDTILSVAGTLVTNTLNLSVNASQGMQLQVAPGGLVRTGTLTRNAAGPEIPSVNNGTIISGAAPTNVDFTAGSNAVIVGAAGDVRVWTGAGLNDFASNGANWDMGTPPPANTGTAIFPIDATPIVNVNYTIRNIIVQSPYTVGLNVDGVTLTIAATGALQNEGSLTVTGTGNLNVAGSTLNTGALTTSATGTQTLAAATNSGTLTVGAGVLTTTTLANSGTVAVGANTLNVTTYTAGVGDIVTIAAGGTANITGNVGTLTMTGGTANITGGITTFNASGASSISCTGTVAAFTVTGGTTALANNTTATTLTNAGTITAGANSLTVTGNTDNTGGTINIGNLGATFGGSFSGAGGTLNGSGGADPTISFSGATITMGTVAINGDTVLFDDTAAQTFDPGAGNTYAAVTVNKTGGTFAVNGNPLSCATLTLTASAGCTFGTAVTAPTLALTAATGPIQFSDNLTVATSLTNAGGNFALNFYGASTAITPAATFGTSGTVRLGNGGDTLAFDGGFTHTTGATAINGALQTTNDTVSTGALTLNGPSSIQTDAGAGDILIGGTITNGVAQNLTLNAGTGNITITGTVGFGTPIGALGMTSSGTIQTNSTVSAASVGITGGAVDLNGTVTAPGGFSSSGTTFDNTGATITTTATNIAINHTGVITIGAALTSNGGTIAIESTDAITLGAALTSGAGNIDIDAAGLTTVADAGDITTTTGNVTFGATGAGLLSTAGEITTGGGTIVFTRDTTITAAVALTTGGGGGDVNFMAALEGVPLNADTLSLTAGTGSVVFSSTVGAGESLGSITVVSATNFAGNAGGGMPTGDIRATSLAQNAGTGTTRLGAITVTGTVAIAVSTADVYVMGIVSAPGGFSSSGTNAASDFDNTGATITTTVNNNIVINHPGAITIGAALTSVTGNINIGAAATGTIALNVASPTNVAETSGGSITFNRPVTLNADTAITTGPGAGNITFGANASITGAQTLTLTAGTGNVELVEAAGTLASLTATGANATFRDNITTSGADGVEVTATTTITLDGLTIDTTAGAGADIDLTGAVTLSTDTAILTAANDITITGAITGAQELQITGAVDVNINNTVNIASLVQTAGSGTTTLLNNVTTSGDNGVNITTATINLDRATPQTIQANGTGIARFDGAVTLTGGSTTTVTTNNGPVSFLSTVDGGDALTVTAGTNNDVTFGNALVDRVGETTPLTSLTVTGGNAAFYGIGNAGNGVTGAVQVTASNAINLYGDNYRSGAGQTWTATTGGVRYRATGSGTWQAGGAGISCPATDLYLDHEGQVLAITSPLSCRSLYFYRGVLSCGGVTFTIGQNLVVFGVNYSANDLDWTGADTRHAYYHASALAYYPTGAIYALPTVTFDVAALPAAAFTNLGGTVLTVGNNFYVNGADMNAGAFTLNIPANDANAPSFNVTGAVTATQWGNPYAVALNMRVNGVTTNVGWVAASMPSAPETNNNIHIASTTTGGTGGWQFGRPAIAAAHTVYDSVLYVELNMPAENSNGEIRTTIEMAAAAPNNGSLWANVDPVPANAIKFGEVFSDPDCFTVLPNGDTDRFYIRTSTIPPIRTWNTDATGISPGNADSTDRSGNGRTVIPNLTALKGLLRAANGKTMSRNYGINTFTFYTATADRCRPALVEVRTGQEQHDNNLAAQNHYDAHNFIELRYSEPVDIGGFNPALETAGWPAPYAQAQTTFGAGDWGGAITGAGPINIEGYATIATGQVDTWQRGTLAVDLPVPLASSTTHTLYRRFSLDGAAAVATNDHRLRISIAGWCQSMAPGWFYQGFIRNATLPSGAVTVLPNQFITDGAGNILEPTNYNAATEAAMGITGYGNFTRANVAKAAVNMPAVPPVADLYGPWDTTPPEFAGVKTMAEPWNGDPLTFEAIPQASLAGNVNRLEMHFIDNEVDYDPGDAWNWRSRSGWYTPAPASVLVQAAPETFGGSRPADGTPTRPTSGGVRDSSFLRANASAFNVANGVETADNAIELPGFLTRVTSAFFNLAAPLDVDDDPYQTILIDEGSFTWPIATATLTVSYNAYPAPGGGFVTDLAGNLMDSAGPLTCLDRAPPQVVLTLAGVNRNELFVLFSKNITDGTTDPAGIEVNLEDGGGPTLITPTAISVGPGSNRVLRFTLPATVSAEHILNASSSITFLATGTMLNPETMVLENITSYGDAAANYVPVGETHRLTDLGVGLLDVLYASDGVNADGVFGAGEGALRVFDGSGNLLDRNITVGTRLTSGMASPLPLTIYFDAKPAAATAPNLFNAAANATSRLWLPSVLPGFNTLGNVAARSLAPDAILNGIQTLRNFTIPEADVDMEIGNSMDMVFRYGGLFCVRLEDETDIASVAPWTFRVAETRRQRGGVTILNNVIDSNRREKTMLRVELPRAGNLVIQVFTLDGNLVRVLERNRRGGGTYTYEWDGTNAGNRPVARGMYFIRVVGPDIDEIRKVMVVKE